jgi:hypothetical protein
LKDESTFLVRIQGYQEGAINIPTSMSFNSQYVAMRFEPLGGGKEVLRKLASRAAITHHLPPGLFELGINSL